MILASCFAVVSCWLAVGCARIRLREEGCKAEADDPVSGIYAQPGATGTVEMATSLTPKLIMMLCVGYRWLMFGGSVWRGCVVYLSSTEFPLLGQKCAGNSACGNRARRARVLPLMFEKGYGVRQGVAEIRG
jgi:hypothetical protein